MARLFEKNGYTSAEGIVLPLSDFRLFTDLPNSDTIEDRYKEGIIKRAEALIGKEYPVILATDYMAYTRTGDRTAYGSKTFPKRGDLVSLVNAELVEGQGRFMDSIINLMWMILEESTWVCNAHNRTGEPLSAQYDTEVGGIDLFSATTGASMAYAYYALKDKLNAISPLFCERTLMMLRRRIINPFINAQDDPGNWWMGIGHGTNNWNPWICSNVLWVVGVVEDDLSVREKTVTWALSYLDNFINLYAPDGGCDEGPGYWGAAGAAYMDCLEIITDLTAGKINIYHEPLIKNVVEYIAKVYVGNGYSLNFADGAPQPTYRREMLASYAKDVKSDMLYSFAISKSGWTATGDHNHVYRGYKYLCTPDIEPGISKAPLKVFFPDLQVAATRESEVAEEGLYVAFKGGCNGESHNHNDVGSIVVYTDGKPMFIDAGSGTYTKRTFSSERYTIWTMNSNYHNTLNFGDTVQSSGKQYHAEVISYDEASGKMTLNLANAYPEAAGVVSYEKSACLENGVITVRDTYKLNEAKQSAFTFLTLGEPESVSEGEFVYMGRTVKFDPALTYSFEEVVCDIPETSNVPKKWKAERICRILLTTPVSDNGDYTLTIE